MVGVLLARPNEGCLNVSHKDAANLMNFNVLTNFLFYFLFLSRIFQKDNEN